MRPHFTSYWQHFRLAFIEKITLALQRLYPYRIFLSPEILEESKCCSICGTIVSIRNPCGHKVGEIYNGECCARIVKKFTILGSALVSDPVQKYSVPFAVDPETGQLQDRYNYSTLEYLAKRWPMPFSDWDAEWTTRLHPKSKFGPIRRNDKCPCDSGKKYKKCCLARDGIIRPHVVFSFHYPIPQHLQTTEYSY